MTYTEANEKIAAKMEKLANEMKQSSMPTDREILQLAKLIYDRDAFIPAFKDHNVDAVNRGVIQGMQIMRQIVEMSGTIVP